MKCNFHPKAFQSTSPLCPAREYRTAARRAINVNWLTVWVVLFLATLLFSYALGPCQAWLSSIPVIGRRIAYLVFGMILMLLIPGIVMAYVRLYGRQKPACSDFTWGFRHPLRSFGVLFLTLLRCYLSCVLYFGIPAGALFGIRLLLNLPVRINSPWLVLFFAVCTACTLFSMLCYIATPVLLVTHPELDALDILARSRQIMKHRRWPLVRLCASYIIWMLLVVLAWFAPKILTCFPTMLQPSPTILSLMAAILGLAVLPATFVLAMYMGAAITGFILHADGTNIFSRETIQ